MNERIASLRTLASVAGLSAPLLAVAPAGAESIIKRPGEHPHYLVEAEPHLLFGWAEPPGVDTPGDEAYGIGARLSIPVADGLVHSINDSAAIGFGGDFLHYYSGRHFAGRCTRSVPGPAGTSVCVETTADGGYANMLVFPVVFQWNFWLTDVISVFGEPGLALTWDKNQGLDFSPLVLWGGARFKLADSVAITLRLGIPTISAGVSFLL
ncbi:MAG: hypothetical protein JW940_21245 [Polyangiaceae bacterium]|nr:hypothetical protein [Polyangiaceae bacterium]